MERYGTDYGARGGWSRGMGRDYGRPMGHGFQWGEGRPMGGRWMGRDPGWGGSSYDEGWRSMERERDFGRGFDSYSGGRQPGYGSYGGYRGEGYERGPRGWGDHDMYGADSGLGGRIRQGWHRVRDEARDWMDRGRGYDRGW